MASPNVFIIPPSPAVAQTPQLEVGSPQSSFSASEDTAVTIYSMYADDGDSVHSTTVQIPKSNPHFTTTGSGNRISDTGHVEHVPRKQRSSSLQRSSQSTQATVKQPFD